MFDRIATKEEIKFKDLEEKNFKFVNMLGCLIIKSILEEQDAQIKQTRDKETYRNKGVRLNTIKTIMGEVEYYSYRMYLLRFHLFLSLLLISFKSLFDIFIFSMVRVLHLKNSRHTLLIGF